MFSKSDGEITLVSPDIQSFLLYISIYTWMYVILSKYIQPEMFQASERPKGFKT